MTMLRRAARNRNRFYPRVVSRHAAVKKQHAFHCAVPSSYALRHIVNDLPSSVTHCELAAPTIHKSSLLVPLHF